MNVTESIRRHAALTPNAVAFESARGESASYATLEATIDAAARRLQALGLAPGQTAVLATGDLGRHIVVSLALARLGVAHAAPSLPARYADIAFGDRSADLSAFARTVALESLLDGLAAAGWAGEPVAFHDADDTVLIHCPSSGTTGAPKFVPLTHELAMRRTDGRISGMASSGSSGGTAAMRMACLVGPGLSYGFSCLLLTLRAGGTVLEPNLDARELPAWLLRSRVSHLVASPIALQKLLGALPDLRGELALECIETGGGLLPAPVHERARTRLCSNILVNYGLTECGRVAGAPAASVVDRPGAVGFPYQHVQVRVVDDDGADVPPGREGSVIVKSPRSASRYLDDPQATARVFRDGWVHPGDRGVLDPDGMLRIVGRVDDVINRGGVKIDPQVIEDAMSAIDDLREVAVFGVAGDSGAVFVCAAIVPTEPLNADAFHARCRERLGSDAPDFIMHMQELPRNPNGKVLRNELARIAIAAHRARDLRGADTPIEPAVT